MTLLLLSLLFMGSSIANTYSKRHGKLFQKHSLLSRDPLIHVPWVGTPTLSMVFLFLGRNTTEWIPFPYLYNGIGAPTREKTSSCTTRYDSHHRQWIHRLQGRQSAVTLWWSFVERFGRLCSFDRLAGGWEDFSTPVSHQVEAFLKDQLAQVNAQ